MPRKQVKAGPRKTAAIGLGEKLVETGAGQSWGRWGEEQR